MQGALTSGGLRRSVGGLSRVWTRGFRSTAVRRSDPKWTTPWYELPLPEPTPRRYNEDIRARSGLNTWDSPAQEPLPFAHQFGYGPHYSDETSFFGSQLDSDYNGTHLEVFGWWGLQLAITFGWIYYSSWSEHTEVFSTTLIPDREMPYYKETVPWWNESMAEYVHRKNPYTDYNGVNPLLRLDYTPDPRPPTLEEAYPNGW